MYLYFIALSVISHRALITARHIVVFTQINQLFLVVIRTGYQVIQKFLYLLGRYIRKVTQLVVLGYFYPCMILFTLGTKWFLTFFTIHSALYFSFLRQTGAS
ncbi:hypothetical protein DPMN_156475 [Dreissena polymorpha]|uniref:Uncharacterized protein n=1 Tax=Dreissena polymorpha TaxID=45954 RepID=A0A9D4J7M2_DREPO|nr:hypothetical protein DPMN_156475 [Dreissena polymorpha]